MLPPKTREQDPCQLSSNVSKERNNMTTDIFAPPPSFPPATSSVSINGAQDALKPGTRIPGSGIVVGLKDTSRGDGYWWCKCWCGREFVEHESSIRNGFSQDCGGPKHHRKPTEALRPLR